MTTGIAPEILTSNPSRKPAETWPAQRHRGFGRLLGAATILAVIAAWALLSSTGALDRRVFPPPRAVLVALQQEIGSGRLIQDLVASLFRVACGLTGAVLLAVPLGLWLGMWASLRAAVLPVVNFLRNLSPLAWIPFAIVWFGIGDPSTVFLIFMATAFPLTVATAAAVASVPRVYLRVAADHGITGPACLATVVLPAVAPQLIAAVRVSAGLAWVVVVSAEMIAGRDGLGFAIWDARNGLRMDLLVCEMVVIGTVGVVLDAAILTLARLPRVRWGYER